MWRVWTAVRLSPLRSLSLSLSLSVYACVYVYVLLFLGKHPFFCLFHIPSILAVLHTRVHCINNNVMASLLPVYGYGYG